MARTMRAPRNLRAGTPRAPRCLAWLAVAMLAICATGCGILPPPPDAVVTGMAYARQRFFIPSGGAFEVAILDVTDADAPPVIIGRQTLEEFERLPVALRIPYRSAQVVPERRYVVRATVSVNGIAWMASEGMNPLQRDPAYRHVDVLLQPLPRSAATEQAAVPLAQTYWKLTEVDGMVVPPAPAGRPQAHLVVQPQEGRIAGSGGCNPFIGTYEMSGGELRIGSIDAGLQLCFDTGLAEGLYLEALRTAEHYRIEGRQLVLARADGPGKEKVLLRFEAPELRLK
ncbi:META domain-containing protein [Paracidovorax cattleyae]|nr:META domain-containing protein [Paracidovorax cattleyae]